MSTNHSRTVGRSITNVRAFEDFLQGWFARQELYLEELRSTLQTSHESKDEDIRDSNARILAHYHQYYEEKSRIANHNVFLVFSPPWFSPFERSFLWIAGVKPGLAFRVVRSSVKDMSEEQLERIETLKMETRAEEKELEDELARIQESLAAPPVLGVVKRLPVEDCLEVDMVIENLRVEMEAVLANADMLRTRTAERVAGILTPVQNLKFLTALTELQLKIRMRGSQMSRQQ